MRDYYRHMARQKFNRLCPDHLGRDQAVVMSFATHCSQEVRFLVHRTRELRHKHINGECVSSSIIQRVNIEDLS